jgi:hypothetical protein
VLLLPAGWWRPLKSCLTTTLIEQDIGAEQRIDTMPSLKGLRKAEITTTGIELMHGTPKGQFGLAPLGVPRIAAPTVWGRCLGRGVRTAQRGAFAHVGHLPQALQLPLCRMARP